MENYGDQMNTSQDIKLSESDLRCQINGIDYVNLPSDSDNYGENDNGVVGRHRTALSIPDAHLSDITNSGRLKEHALIMPQTEHSHSASNFTQSDHLQFESSKNSGLASYCSDHENKAQFDKIVAEQKQDISDFKKSFNYREKSPSQK